jgi:hypothetical protein
MSFTFQSTAGASPPAGLIIEAQSEAGNAQRQTACLSGIGQVGAETQLSTSLPISAAGTPLFDSSASAGTTPFTLTLPAVVGKTTYIAGFRIDGYGATALAAVYAQLTGLDAVKTPFFPFSVPAGVTLAIPPVLFLPGRALPAYQVNQAIQLNVPAFGAGNTLFSATMWGFAL